MAQGQPEIEAVLDIYALDSANKNTRPDLERLLDKVDMQAAWRQYFYGGFDTYEDYVKYGAAFTPVESGGIARATR